jgi:sugar phosphate isomerase/epimerase
MIRIAYEGLSWATRNNTWQTAWDVVRRADRPNVGLVMDTFHVLVQEFPSMLNPTTSTPLNSTEEALSILRASMSSFSTTVLGSKIFLVQLADAAIIEPAEFLALGSTHKERLRTYARTRRLYPGEKGGWMPTEVVVEALERAGYKGPWSLELFHSRLGDSGREVPGREAEKGQESLRWLKEAGKQRRGGGGEGILNGEGDGRAMLRVSN